MKKISKKIFVMINKVAGGGQFLDSVGGRPIAHGGPPTRENPGLSSFRTAKESSFHYFFKRLPSIVAPCIALGECMDAMSLTPDPQFN